MNSIDASELRGLLDVWKCSELSDKLVENGFTISNLEDINDVTILYLFSGQAKYLGALLRFKRFHGEWMKTRAVKQVPVPVDHEVVKTFPNKSVAKRQLAASSGVNSDEEETRKKSKMIVSEELIEEYIGELMNGADYDVLTFKDVRKRVLSKYPLLRTQQPRLRGFNGLIAKVRDLNF